MTSEPTRTVPAMDDTVPAPDPQGPRPPVRPPMPSARSDAGPAASPDPAATADPPIALGLAQVEVRYPGAASPAVDTVDLHVRAGEVLALLGPSGCGKSSLLRAIAGLELPSAGTIAWAGRDLAGVPAYRRGFGLMFQEGQLFPHRSVAGNVEFGLLMDRVPRAARRERVRELLDLVGLAGYGDRPTATLSGGEQQRVALARALAPRPRLLLLDEPLSALDRSLRERLTVELATILRRAAATALYVTHDHDEAFTIADRVGIMRAGRLVQVGRPAEIWSRPADAPVAAFLGFAVISDDDDRTWALGPRALWVTAPGESSAPAAGPIAPRTGRIRSLGFQRGEPAARLDVPGWGTVRALLRPASAGGPDRPAPGDVVQVHVDPLGVVLLEG
ncbi:ABC transporter ATP-binding protein [Pseudactinotalea sp. HY160]|uniref:ABC transporter ATP-binding protein n=1 Tax=Pseudactinotalea sp. HY160 TaxID=2654490 RepID=UPI00351B05A3